MTYTLPNVSDASIVALGDDDGPAAVIALQRRIVRALDAGHRLIVVDLAAAAGLGEQGLTLLCGAMRFLSRCGATLAMAACPAHVQRDLERFELQAVEFHPTVHAALTARPASHSVPIDLVDHRRTSATTKGLRQHA